MMKKDVKWMKGRLEELRRMDMRMWKLCEPNSGEQRHFDGRLAAIEEALEFIDNLDDHEEPYSIQKLIHDYEYKTGTFDWATALRGVLRDGSEETEVKKDREYLRSVIQRRIDNLPSTYEGLYIEGSRDAYDLVLQDIDQLDESEVTLDRAFEEVSKSYPMTKEEIWRHLEQIVAHGGKVTYGEPEVLSLEWIEEHTYYEDEYDFYYADPDELKNLLVPKQEELESKIKVLIEAYKQEEDAYSNPENGWINGFIEDLKNLVEKEQKYHVTDENDTLLCKSNGVVMTVGKLWAIGNEREAEYDLTEQEIKDYDQRYWAFAKPVEENE